MTMARAENSDHLQVSRPDRGIDFGKRIQQRQGRHRLQLADAEVTTHRGDGGRVGTGRRQSPKQGRERISLLSRIARWPNFWPSLGRRHARNVRCQSRVGRAHVDL